MDSLIGEQFEADPKLLTRAETIQHALNRACAWYRDFVEERFSRSMHKLGIQLKRFLKMIMVMNNEDQQLWERIPEVRPSESAQKKSFKSDQEDIEEYWTQLKEKI